MLALTLQAVSSRIWFGAANLICFYESGNIVFGAHIHLGGARALVYTALHLHWFMYFSELCQLCCITYVLNTLL